MFRLSTSTDYALHTDYPLKHDVGCDWWISILTFQVRMCSLRRAFLFCGVVVYLDRGYLLLQNLNVRLKSLTGSASQYEYPLVNFCTLIQNRWLPVLVDLL